ncbi:GP179 protein, partial [Pitta sordida]|nr:GP179 protein [Pitta sordida]
ERLEGTSGTIWDHTEKEQAPAKATPRSPQPSTTGLRGQQPGAEVCPLGYLGIPAGRGALLRQEAIVSREDSGLPGDKESPTRALEKGSSQPEVPGTSWSEERSLDAAGRRQGEICPRETREESSTTRGTGPGEWSEDTAPGKDGREGHPQHAREEPGTEKPPAQTPELPKAAPEQGGTTEGRRAEVCPWESRERGRSVRAEICPWDTQGAQLQLDRQEGKRKSIRPKSLALPRAQESGSSLGAADGLRGRGVEQPGMGIPAKLPTVPKPSPQQAGTADSRKATVCPWEVEDEPPPKTEICPWEEAAAPAGKEGSSHGTCKGEGKAGARGVE